MDEKERKELEAALSRTLGETVAKALHNAGKLDRQNGYVRRNECRETRELMTGALREVVETQKHHTGKLDAIGADLRSHIDMDDVRETERARADKRVADVRRGQVEYTVADRMARLAGWKLVAAWVVAVLAVLGAIVSATFFFARLQARTIAKQYQVEQHPFTREAVNETPDDR